MERAITGFHLDDEGDWVAELDCGHNQHVRHRPPFQLRPWVVEPEGRRSRLGSPLNCPRCEWAELPEGLESVRWSPEWDEESMPAALRRLHRLGPATWGRLEVRSGRMRFAMRSDPELDVVVETGSSQAIPPQMEHGVEPLGPVRFAIEFLSVPRRVPDPDDEEAGDPACYAHLLCPECGAVLDGGGHRPGCPLAAGPG